MKVERGIEQEVDRIIQGLADVTIPSGLEGRVLARTQERVSAARLRWLPARSAAAVAACVLTVAVIAGIEIRDHGRVTSAPAQSSNRIAPHEVRSANSGPVSAIGSAVPAALVPPRRQIAVTSAARVPVDAGGSRGSSEEARAMAEMLAPSMPEQAAPLTRQEQLLLRVAVTSDAPELAQDSLSARAAREQIDEQLQQQIAALGLELGRELNRNATGTTSEVTE